MRNISQGSISSMVALLTLITAGTLSGCATTATAIAQTPPKPDSATSVTKTESAVEDGLPSEPALPNVELTADLLNDLLLADVASKRGHFDKAVALYAELAQNTKDPRLAALATRTAQFARRDDVAVQTGELWIKLDPENIDARQMLAALYIRTGDRERALRHFEKILNASEKSADNGYMVIAGLLSREKDKKTALEVMKQLTDLHPEDADGAFAYSNLAVRLGELDEALSAVDHTLTIRPDWVSAVVHKSRVLQAQGKIVPSLNFLKDAVTRFPDVAEYRLVYARALADADRFVEAYDQFKKLDEIKPGDEDIKFALGFLALQIGLLDDAERHFMAIKDRSSRSSEIYYYLGRLEEERGNDKKAKAWYQAIADGEHYLNSQIRIIVINARNGQMDEARSLIDTLKQQRPAQRLRLYLVEGEVLTEHEKYKEAFEVYSRALSEFPDNNDLLYARSMAAEKLDMLDQMEQDLRSILARNPNNAEALNALGYTLADRTTRFQEALDLVSRALELRPADYFIVDSLGWVYFRLGNFGESIKYLRRALDMKLDLEVAAHLGEVLWVTGDKESAREVWQKALSANPKGKKQLILEVMRRLDANS